MGLTDSEREEFTRLDEGSGDVEMVSGAACS